MLEDSVVENALPDVPDINRGDAGDVDKVADDGVIVWAILLGTYPRQHLKGHSARMIVSPCTHPLLLDVCEVFRWNVGGVYSKFFLIQME